MDRPSGQQTRRRLLDAAGELIAECGWGRVTTRAVAERAGLPHGAVSYHFAGKQALLAEAALDRVERWFPLPRVRAAGGLASLVSSMRDWAGTAPAADRVGGAVSMEAMREATRDPAVRERLVALLREYRQAVADLARVDQRTGAVPPHVDAVGLATLVTAAGDGLLLHAMLDSRVELAGAVEALGGLLAAAGGSRRRGRVATGPAVRR